MNCRALVRARFFAFILRKTNMDVIHIKDEVDIDFLAARLRGLIVKKPWERIRIEYSYQGAKEDKFFVHYFQRYKMWIGFKNRESSLIEAIVGFSETKPKQSEKLNSVAEINIGIRGQEKRFAGFFAKDDEGNAYLCHSGKFSQRRAEEFLEFAKKWGLEIVHVVGGPREGSYAVLVTDLNECILPAIRDFADVVLRFKKRKKAS